MWKSDLTVATICFVIYKTKSKLRKKSNIGLKEIRMSDKII